MRRERGNALAYSNAFPTGEVGRHSSLAGMRSRSHARRAATRGTGTLREQLMLIGMRRLLLCNGAGGTSPPSLTKMALSRRAFHARS
jgi:hypothetical protein